MSCPLLAPALAQYVARSSEWLRTRIPSTEGPPSNEHPVVTSENGTLAGTQSRRLTCCVVSLSESILACGDVHNLKKLVGRWKRRGSVIGCMALAFCDVVWRWPAMAGSDRRGEGKLVWLGPRVSDDASPQWRLARSDARDRAVGRRPGGRALGRPPLGRVRLSHSWRPEFLGCALCYLALGRASAASCKLQLCVAL